ncbi:MAG: bifunctional adenosylcobinamide kinase/adenosylcobinamide-phosphate guanylyltransferase [Clostridiales bacterium]|nr:bifunctional adenosylcobinamide kinase/adenosylcobinamide-phosphate guanylyltransferase [Candidatus Apopatocola equi]MCQ2439165.1 bifunctional adenosylcobinamide kinase/adenosylcobinamide-phosphate guanylyltransferase [Oscillospiraceae bacterium]
MKMFFSGGCKNGKSGTAEDCARVLAGDRPLYYLATMIPHDDEDRERIARHVASRAGKGFITVECGRHIPDALQGIDASGCFLLDAVTSLLNNEMFHDGITDFAAGERVAKELCQLAERVGSIVFVSDYIYSDAERYDEFTESYRQALALCDRALAEVCDTVVEINLGIPILYKGVMPL